MIISFDWEYRPHWTYHGVFQYAHMVPKRMCDFCGTSATTTLGRNDICSSCFAWLRTYADKIMMDAEVLSGLMRKLGWRSHGIDYGRPWQDHVPDHSKHLIKDTP